jgi:hypothetical protein
MSRARAWGDGWPAVALRLDAVHFAYSVHQRIEYTMVDARARRYTTKYLSLSLGIVLLGAFASCGEDAGETSAIEACSEGGGSWFVDGCGGVTDVCGVTACSSVLAAGCHCEAAGQCWDSAARRCRPE